MYPNIVVIGDSAFNLNYMVSAERLGTRRGRVTMVRGRSYRLSAEDGSALLRKLHELGIEDLTPAAPPPIDDCRTCRLAERIAGALRGPRTDNR